MFNLVAVPPTFRHKKSENGTTEFYLRSFESTYQNTLSTWKRTCMLKHAAHWLQAEIQSVEYSAALNQTVVFASYAHANRAPIINALQQFIAEHCRHDVAVITPKFGMVEFDPETIVDEKQQGNVWDDRDEQPLSDKVKQYHWDYMMELQFAEKRRLAQ